VSRRISTAIVAVVLASLLLVGFATFVVARNVNRDRELVRLEQQARAISELVPPAVPTARTTPNTDAGAQAIRTRQRVAAIVQLTGVAEVQLGPDGGWRGRLPRGVVRADLDPVALRAGETISGRRLQVLWAAAGRTDDRGITSVVVVTARQEGVFGPTMRWFSFFAAIAVLLGALVAAWLGRRLARPVHEATETTRRLAAGDLGARMPTPPDPDDTDELAVLARSVDAMAAELERSHGLERQFLLSVSHDLRTPLTSIRGYAEAIADGVVDDPARGASVILEESRRLERLVGDLLDLAKLDARQFRFTPTTVATGDLVAAAGDRIAALVGGAGLRLDVSDDAGTWLHVDADRLVQAIGNLGANAARFARTTVWLRCRSDVAPWLGPNGEHGTVVAIDVADDGPGIAAGDLPHVFERLYQSADQPEHAAGAGLGLAIVRELTEAMGGQVSVVSPPGAGATFTLRFPAAPPPGR